MLLHNYIKLLSLQLGYPGLLQNLQLLIHGFGQVKPSNLIPAHGSYFPKYDFQSITLWDILLNQILAILIKDPQQILTGNGGGMPY
jgi:hypothetical protein